MQKKWMNSSARYVILLLSLGSHPAVLVAMRKPWSHIQPTLFPWMHEELDPVTEKLEHLIHILDDLDIEAVVRTPVRGPGAPLQDRSAIARAFVAKAVLNVPTTTALRERLQIDRPLLRICGWERRTDVPSESTFSRAFAEFAQDGAAERLHEALVTRRLGDRIVGHVSRDATEIEARERPAKKEKEDSDAPPPAPKRRRGRPRKGEEPPPKPPTRLERQRTQTLPEMLADLPTACDVGTKRNSKGFKETWIGYKLHIDTADGMVPVSAVLTSASVHDSQAAIPLARLTAKRITHLYDIMDAAYDARVIIEDCQDAGRVPVIDRNCRGNAAAKAERAAEAERRRLLNLPDSDAWLYNERSNAERAIGRLKDDFGGRYVRVRGAVKVCCHLTFGLAAMAADSLLRLRSHRMQPA